MRIAIVVITLAATALSAQTPRAAQQEIDHVAAFARLYGVVRYLLPWRRRSHGRLEPVRCPRRRASPARNRHGYP